MVHHSLRKFSVVLQYHQQHLILAGALGDSPGEGRALQGLGNAHLLLGNCDLALDIHFQNLALVRQLCDIAGEGAALGGIGNVYDQQQDYAPPAQT